ncbi:hypothetical protein ILYODFUR_010406 [Ilyodon furcidens]|uniref:Uncharacterized protein n=1 Tax=Ilyodon furcidens TaxID=33524 RepID=A0ABV0T880_9TELE
MPGDPQYFQLLICTKNLFSKQIDVRISSSLPVCLFKQNYMTAFWTSVPQRACVKFIGKEFLPFDTRDAANRSLAISLLLQLLCNGDLFLPPSVYLNCENQRLMAPWEIFISNAFPLSDLIQSCCRSCRLALYIYSPLEQTRAAVTNLTINTLAGVMCSEMFL